MYLAATVYICVATSVSGCNVARCQPDSAQNHKARRSADPVMERRIQALEEQGRRRKSVKALWLCPVAVGIMLVLLAQWVCLDADLKAAMSERIGTLEETVQKGMNDKVILSQEIAEATNIARALQQEIDRLAKKLYESVSQTHVNVAALQREIDQLGTNAKDCKNDVEALKQQLKQKQDEAAFQTRTEAIRQELIDLLRDKQSKKSFLLENSLIKQELEHLKQNEEALKREIELLKNKTANPPAECEELTSENDSPQRDVSEPRGRQDLVQQEPKDIFQNELETMKRQLKLTQDEAASKSRTEAIRLELTDLLRDKQSKKSFLLENSLIKQELEHLKQNEEALKREIELLKNKTAIPPAESEEVTTKDDLLNDVVELKGQQDLLRQELKHCEHTLKNELETLKQQLKLKQDEAASKSRTEAVRQELVDLLRDKPSKKSFLLENSLIKQEMDHLKQHEEALMHEMELLKSKIPAENYSLHVFELTGQQELVRQELKHHEQEFKNELETLKQQLELKSAMLRKELTEMVHHKQAEITSKLGSMPTQQELNGLKQDLLQKQQASTAEIIQLRQEIDFLKQSQYRPTCKKKIGDVALNASDYAMKELIEVTRKQETDRKRLERDIAKLWDRHVFVSTIQPKIHHLMIRQSDHVFRKEIETMQRLSQNHQLRGQAMEELILRQVVDTQTELSKLTNFCSQTPMSSALEEYELETLAQQGLSAESVWRLVVVLWMIFYILIYHHKFRNQTQGKIHELIKKQEADREYLKESCDVARVEVDKLKEDQESDRTLLRQVIDAQGQRMTEKTEATEERVVPKNRKAAIEPRMEESVRYTTKVLHPSWTVLQESLGVYAADYRRSQFLGFENLRKLRALGSWPDLPKLGYLLQKN